jgi:hypothetical protein
MNDAKYIGMEARDYGFGRGTLICYFDRVFRFSSLFS